MEQVKIGNVTWTVKTNTPKKDLREAVKEQIRLHPETYRQSTFCGTECCIAGHAGLILGDIFPMGNEGEWIVRMRLAMGVREGLFGTGHFWEGGLGDEFCRAAGQEKRAEIACRAIDYYAIED